MYSSRDFVLSSGETGAARLPKARWHVRVAVLLVLLALAALGAWLLSESLRPKESAYFADSFDPPKHAASPSIDALPHGAAECTRDRRPQTGSPR